MLTTKTLEGFGGLLRRYCPERCGPIFTEVIKKLLTSSETNQAEAVVNTVMNKEKLVALLTNRVGNSQLYNNKMRHICWQPLADVDIDRLAEIVGEAELKRIEKENLGKRVLHCYRISNISNRHGYGNYHPNMSNQFSFEGYNCRH